MYVCICLTPQARVNPLFLVSSWPWLKRKGVKGMKTLECVWSFQMYKIGQISCLATLSVREAMPRWGRGRWRVPHMPSWCGDSDIKLHRTLARSSEQLLSFVLAQWFLCVYCLEWVSYSWFLSPQSSLQALALCLISRGMLSSRLSPCPKQDVKWEVPTLLRKAVLHGEVALDLGRGSGIT